MAFTIKYRSFQPSAAQPPAEYPTNFDSVEQLSGPYDLVSQEMVDGLLVVHAHGDNGYRGCTFGPYKDEDENVPFEKRRPRPTLWVMNESGATVAKYDL